MASNKNSLTKNVITLTMFAIMIFILFNMIDFAHASDASSNSSSGGLPWEAPLKTLRDSVSGPVAFGISLLAIVAGGIALVFGGEINEFIKRIIYLCLVISVIVFANSLLTGSLFSGALVPSDFNFINVGK